MIDTQEGLVAFLGKLRSADWVAVDTEADSLHAYPEKICLIQISTAHEDRLVDPLAELDISPLLEALLGRELIMHGADYDLRLLHKHYRYSPTAIFDTMLAARLLGALQFSLSSLVEARLGVKLEKGAQKADWARRPLTERMEQYARRDTHYLKPLADKLRPELESARRLDWHREACARLVSDCAVNRAPDPDQVWRVRGSHVLSRQGLAVLRELFGWRESEALAAGKPPFFVMSHQTLIAISEAAGDRPVEPLLPRHLSDRRRAGLLKALAGGLAVPLKNQPDKVRNITRRPSEAERKRCAELARRRDHHAAALRIDPTLIASRAMLAELAQDWDKHAPELMNWQRELLEG
jgi:ribonuclease D